MKGKVTDAAVEAAIKAYEKLSEWGDSLGNDAERECMRTALEAAMPHLQPAKPEAVRLRDELRERAEFEKWAGTQLLVGRSGSLSPSGQIAWQAWQAAIAARELVCGTCAEVIQHNALTGTTCGCARQPVGGSRW